MAFNRSQSGKASQFLFYSEPLIWVEGPEDVPFFRQLLRDCRVRPADGEPECRKLIDELINHNLPYVVVLDGHYHILKSKRSPNRRVIILKRHSTENYLFEKYSIEEVSRNLARVDSSEELVGNLFEQLLSHLEEHLRELVVLDVAHQLCGSGKCTFPRHADRLLLNNPKISLDKAEIAICCQSARHGLAQNSIDEANALIDDFLSSRRFVDILRGHFVFGIIRRLLYHSVKSKTGRNPNIDNDTLRALLATQVWVDIPTKDHFLLKKYLLRAVAETKSIRPSYRLASTHQTAVS